MLLSTYNVAIGRHSGEPGVAELKKLGRYELRSVLGKGAMGVVYEGYDPTLGRRVAVKTILKSVALDDETERNYAERFVREAKAVARLNHPNIVQVHDFGVENEVAYLVMEFIQGRELRSFFTAGEKFESAEVVRIMGELLDAQRRVKLADFGVARVQDSDRSAAGTMVGTPAFMSPEQISGGKIDRRTDVFSAGVLFYQLLTGEQPFKGEGAWTVAKQIMQDDPPRPSTVVQSVSPIFDGIVNKSLAKKPGERYASAREFALALRSAHVPAPEAVAPKPKTREAPKASETELEFWRAIQNSSDAAEFEFYLEQFPEGTYAALARHKIAKLRDAPDAQATVRLEAEAQAKLRAAEEKARRDAEEQARRKAEEETARREAEAKAKRKAEEKALRETLERTRREAAEKARRETEEKLRQSQALARLRQEQAAVRAKAAVDEDATVAIGSAKSAAAPVSRPTERKSSYAMPLAVAAIVAIAGIGVFLFLGRTPAPAPVTQAPVPAKAPAPAAAPPKAELSTADIDKIRKETEERIRREYADKSAAEQARAAKAAADREVQEKQLAMKAAAEKAAQEKLLAAKLSAEKAAAEKLAAEKAAAEKSARLAAEKAAEEKAAAAKAAEEKAAAAAKAAAVAVAAVAPAVPARGGVQPGRYTFRFLPGGGIGNDCDRIGFQEDIEVQAGRSISGREFNGLQFQEGLVAASVVSVSSGRGAQGAKLTGRPTANGYAGSYDWGGGNRQCTGQWTLVRRVEATAAELPGRYVLYVTAGRGVMQECDRLEIKSDIDIGSGTSKGVSGEGFSELLFTSVPGGSITGQAWGGRSRFGSGQYQFTGRANPTGYEGEYFWKIAMGGGCSGRWSLVRK